MWQLQWGRGLVTAESGSTRSLRGVTRICFNGAAVLGPRRDSGTARPGTPRHPCFNGAAVLGPRRVRDTHDTNDTWLPSMGPRSWDRGEPPHSRRRRHRTGTFNGAAVLGPRRAEADFQTS